MKKNSSASVMETESGSALTTGEKVMRYWAHNWQLWLMLLPGIIYIFVFCYVPMYGVQLAFRDYSFASGITGGKWEGFKYFKQYFESPMFFPTLRNTFVIALTSIIVGFPAPIILAMIIKPDPQYQMEKSSTDHRVYSLFHFGCSSGFDD